MCCLVELRWGTYSVVGVCLFFVFCWLGGTSCWWASSGYSLYLGIFVCLLGWGLLFVAGGAFSSFCVVICLFYYGLFGKAFVCGVFNGWWRLLRLAFVVADWRIYVP